MILACDPGLRGALAFYAGDGSPLVWDMPTRKQVVNRKERDVIDEIVLRSHFHNAKMFGPQILVIEQVGGMPGQSGPAAFTFGYGVGLVTAFALAEGLIIERVAPSQWKSALRLGRDKDDARAMAAKQFPALAHMFARKKDDGRAEACLMAWYGWMTRGGMDQ